MKKLVFVRHAKAEPEGYNSDISDFERSLVPSGKKVAKQMARLFLKKEASPGLIITSPAFRALETALIFAGEAGVSYDNIILNSNLYSNINTERLLDIISSVGDDMTSVTLFGHNPSFSNIPDKLSRTGCNPLPKTGVACISFDTDKWSDLGKGNGKLEYLLKPEKE